MLGDLVTRKVRNEWTDIYVNYAIVQGEFRGVNGHAIPQVFNP